MAKILLVEDNNTLSMVLSAFLTSEHHVVDSVSSGTEGLDRALHYAYDVLILDWDLPELSGVEICNRYRESGGRGSVLMLTGKSSLKDKEKGLDSGADDYLTKPFAMEELAARVRALLRRSPTYKHSVLTFGDLSLDTTAARLTKNGVEVHLLPKELALLEFFMRHPDQPFTADALVERVWSTTSEMSAEAVRPYINRLRAKVDSADCSSMIKTIRGRGYKLSLSESGDSADSG